jgi:cytochrome c oxidase assembly factor CtaG
MGVPVTPATITILAAWDFEPSIVVGCAGLLALYAWQHRGDWSRAGWFCAGVALMALALMSPLDTLSDSYLFSAHMVQHMVLILIVPPLLLLGISTRAALRALAMPAVAKIERVLAKPAVAWTMGIGTLFAWHLPAFYNAALANEDLHIFEHLCFLVAATIFWWPILAPVEEARMAPLPALVYLATAAVANSALGILLTFAEPGLYPAYLHPADPLEILATIRNSWGLTPDVDQELGGLLMWVPGGFVFLGAMIAVLSRWYRDSRAPATGVVAWGGPR